MAEEKSSHPFTAEEFRAFRKAHPRFEFKLINPEYAPEAGERPESKAALRVSAEQLGACKRLANLHEASGVQAALREKGIVSALQVSAMTENYFAGTYAPQLGMDEETARLVHQRAVKTQGKVRHLLANIKTTVGSGHFRSLPVNTLGDDLVSYFEKLPSYQELFGSLDYCECEDCKSIFGPAAYFVDLMRIVDQYISRPNRNTIPPQLSLKARRPDLEYIPLTCAKTNDLVPYLQIANERLLDAAGTLCGPEENRDPFRALANTVYYPFGLPFNLLLEEIRICLRQAGTSLAEVYRAWKADGRMTARERLELSPEEYDFLKTRASEGKLALYYGLEDKSELTGLAAAAKFLEATGLQMKGLTELICRNLSQREMSKGIAHNFYINQGLPESSYLVLADRDPSQAPSIQNLDNDALDRLNRFLRLAQKLKMGYEELDWLLRTLSGGGEPAISGETLTALAEAKELAGELDLDLPEFSVLLGPLKTYGEGRGGSGSVPFDLIFNTPHSLKEDEQPYHPQGNPLNPLYTSPLKTWQAGGSRQEDLDIAGWLAGSLGVSPDDLNRLGAGIFGPAAQISLTVDNLSVFRRHTLLAGKLGLPMAQYLLALKLARLPNLQVFSLEQTVLLLELSRLLSRAGLNVYQLDYFLNAQESPYAKALYQAEALAAWLPSLWQAGGNGVSSGLGAAAKAGVAPVAEEDQSSTEDKVLVSLSTFLGAAKEMLAVVMIIVQKAVALPAGVDHWAQAFLTPPAQPGDPSPYRDYIAQVMSYISRWLSAGNSLALSEDLVAAIGHYPAAYGFGEDLQEYTWQNLADLERFKGFFSLFSDQDHDLLRYVEAQAGQGPDPLKILAGVTGWDAAQIQTLLTTVLPRESNLVRQIDALRACFALMAQVGGDPAFLKGLLGLNSLPAARWDTYIQLATGVLQRLQGQYDPGRWPAVFAQVNGKVELKKREALLSLVLWKLHRLFADIKTPDDVYKFLLIDVEMDESTQISYVKEALNAVQLYLQRCRLKLERGVLEVDIQDSWWSWLMNYRLWEANRKIFVYPENYLVPSIRRTKTRLFADLEDSLQQSEATEAYVESAYNNYLEDFSAIAQLTPVESCCCPTLFLFGRTRQQPYTYYYCRREEGRPWSEWEKIELTINSQSITPVFAFKRLFIFWSELKKTASTSIDPTGSGSKSSNSSTYKLEIYYSFLNLQGKWVNPQSLLSEFIAYYSDAGDGASLSRQAPFAGLYAMDSLPWLKVHALPVTGANLPAWEGKGRDFERLTILFGPFLNNTGRLLTLEPRAGEDSDRGAFESSLRERGLNFNRMVAAMETGCLSAAPNLSLNGDLASDFLIRRNEYILADGYSPNQAPIPFKPVVDKLNNILGIVYSQEVIYDNYLGEMEAKTIQQIQPQALNGNSFTSPSIDNKLSAGIFKALKEQAVLDSEGNIQGEAVVKLDLEDALRSLLGTPDPGRPGHCLLEPSQLGEIQKVLFGNMGGLALFSQVGAPEATIKSVGNQPGWFIYNNGDEAFLLSPQDKTAGGSPSGPPFSRISDGLSVSRALLGKTSFLAAGLDYTPSQKALALLQSYSLVDEKGRVNTCYATPEMVKMVLANLRLQDKQINAVYRLLQNFPTVYPDTFVGADIAQNVSQMIYNAFKVYSIIDDYGRVDLNLAATVSPLLILGDLIAKGTVNAAQVPGIYDGLVHAPTATALKYWNACADPALTRLGDCRFTVQRLSTGAIGPLQRHIFSGGIKRLLSLKSQNIPVIPVQPFDRLKPNPANLDYPAALDGTQVDFDGLYGEYYWELFFHIPMFLAQSLQANNQNAQAQEWYHYIFNPTRPEQLIGGATFSYETEGLITPEQSQAVWQSLQRHRLGNPPAPLVDGEGRVNPRFSPDTDLSFLQDLKITEQSILMIRNVLLNYRLATPSGYYWQFQPFRTHLLESLQDMLADSNPAVQVYNDYPFDPYAIARLRIGAFEKNVVMQYVDNLVQWGDQMFMEDTWESITAATMLYVLAFDLLGPRPVNLGPCKSRPEATFKEIEERYKDKPGGIPQFLLDLETIVTSEDDRVGLGTDTGFNDLGTYFGIPENPKLIGYWDTVEDRLYKIRHSLNIKGEKRSLALFEPPLNPLLLAKAGGALNNVLPLAGEASPQLSPYRFTFLLERAKALAGQVTQLGGALLAALEKKDAECLSLLHTTQEAAVLNLTTTLKENQIQELNQTVESLQASLQGAHYRQAYYSGQIKAGLSEGEKTNLVAMDISMAFSMFASTLKLAAGIAHAVPQAGSPFAMTYGGIQLGAVVDATAGAAEIGAAISNYIAQRSITMAGYQRRREDWVLQRDCAGYEAENIGGQLEAAQTRVASARQELAVHKKSLEQNREVYDFLKSKFSNGELYQWLGGRLSTFLWQSYLTALDWAYQAQNVFRLEMDSEDRFINFDYWDSRRKGLLAGEGLALALSQMEGAYLKRNNRRLEIEKTVSLAAAAPEALLALKSGGKCSFKLTEELYDYDFPGHYARKIKSVAISIPAVVGPYQTLKATLSQTYNAVVTKPRLEAVKYLLNHRQGDQPAEGLRENWLRGQKIAVSRGVDDCGMFVLNFNDERYLPFEDTGAVSDWELELPKETNRFNFESIADVILNVKYTALEDAVLGEKVQAELARNPYKGGLYYNLKQNFSSGWFAFLNGHSEANAQKLEFGISASPLSYFQNVKLKAVYLRLSTPRGTVLPAVSQFMSLTIKEQPAKAVAMTQDIGEIAPLNLASGDFGGQWSLQVDLTKLRSDEALRKLLKDGQWLDEGQFKGLEMILLYEGNFLE